ncbi:uncharacterized protein LOC144579780 [Callithrix jacchus]
MGMFERTVRRREKGKERREITRKEGREEGGTGERAGGRGGARGRRAQEEERARSPLAPACGTDHSGAAAAAPGRAAPALPREAARRAREGRAGAVGRGDYSISQRRIGCIQSQSGCKLRPRPRSGEVRAIQAVVGDGGRGGWELGGGVGRAWRRATFCSCHRVNAGQLPGHPPPLPGNFFQQPSLTDPNSPLSRLARPAGHKEISVSP